MVAAQIMERILHGQPQIDAFTKLLDDLQKQRDEIEGSLATGRTKRRGPPKTFTINPAMYAAAIGALTAVARTGANDHDDVQRHLNFLRTLVQKIVCAICRWQIRRVNHPWPRCRCIGFDAGFPKNTAPVCVNSTQASSPAGLGRGG